ncbi:hypothetical protein LTR04_003982, partial [Oleoguttula sp. CCFEE 6159]
DTQSPRIRSWYFDKERGPSKSRIQQYRRRDVPRRIHILGTGSVGKLVAHSLRGIPNPPPITLLFHRRDLLKKWRHEGEQIKLTTHKITESRNGYDVEVAAAQRRLHGTEVPLQELHSEETYPGLRPHEIAALNSTTAPISQDVSEPSLNPEEEEGDDTSDETIHNVVVTVKAASTVSALSAIRHRLTRGSTVLFLQNGMGILEEVNREVFPDIETRPNYMLGIISHGVNSTSTFSVVHAGFGTIALGLVPRYAARQLTNPAEPTTESWAPTSRYLLRTLTRTPVLAAVGFAPTELLQAQLEKLAVNAVVNPLTVMLDARNGSILYNYALSRVMRLLLSEISLVIRSLPELRGLPNVNTRFAPDRLETLVVGVAHRTRDNISSMLADVRKGKQTEIEYITGYVVKRGEEMGIKCVMNYMMLQMVIGKQNLINREEQEDVPVVGTDKSVVGSK